MRHYVERCLFLLTEWAKKDILTNLRRRVLVVKWLASSDIKSGDIYYWDHYALHGSYKNFMDLLDIGEWKI